MLFYNRFNFSTVEDEFDLRDSRAALDIRAELPPESAALKLLRRGAVSGFSVEFHARESETVDGVRVVKRAALVGIGLVDDPSYGESMAELRARGDRGGRLFTARGRIPVGRTLDCRCSPGNCREALFENGAFDNVTRDEAREILAVAGEYANAVAARTRGGVRFWKGRDGELEYAIDVPNTARGRQLRETMDSAPVYGRPVLDTDLSDFDIDGPLATYREARVRAITVGPTDASKGWTPHRGRTGRGRAGNGPEAGAMAVAVLSPWPTTPAALALAVACLKTGIAGGSGLADDRAAQLGETAAALVERFAPDAPAPIKREAVLRTAGYIFARVPRATQSVTAGSLRIDFRERHASPDALRHSGARAMLLPWRARRALAIEETD